MNQKKFQFKDIKSMLSREEMKQIRGGSGGCNFTFDSNYRVSCPTGQSPAGCLNSGGNVMPYCYVDSSGACYHVGAASCTLKQ